MSEQLSTKALANMCDEYLWMLEAGELPLSEQQKAGWHLRERIRILTNTCQAGFEGKFLSGKWRRAEEQFDCYDDVKRSER